MDDFEIEFSQEKQDFLVDIDNPVIEFDIGFGAQSGSSNHDDLNHRDYPNQHPISSITGLQNIIDSLEGKYFKEFTSENWELNGLQYQLIIPQSEHLLADPYITKLEMLKDGEYKSVSMYGNKLLPNGNIRILSDLQYSGRVLLKGGK